MIVRLDRVRGRGILRSHSGKEIPFQFPYVTVVGARVGGAMSGIELLHEGDSVGFDVGWTSRGLRVTVIKSKRQPGPREASEPTSGSEVPPDTGRSG